MQEMATMESSQSEWCNQVKNSGSEKGRELVFFVLISVT